MNEDNNQVAASTPLRIPEFWNSNPRAWFIRIEAQFTARRIVRDDTKYDYLLSSLPEDIIMTVLDHIEAPPEDNKYTTLKDILVRRNSESEEIRLGKLLSNYDMGNQRPGDFYRHMQSLTGGTIGVTGDLLQKLWLRKLPSGIQIAIHSSGKNDIVEQQDLADKIWDGLHGQCSSLSSKKSDDFSLLRLEIEELKKQLSSFCTDMHNHRSRSLSSGKNYNSRNRSQSRSDKKHDLCWYHFKFGHKATKCNQPDCKFEKYNNQSLN